MSKKVISVLLSVAILATMLCVGVGMLTASADTVTYYFLAPDSYLQTNDTVGVYYWQPKEPAPWPGVEMKKAESVGKNVFSTTVGDNDETEFIIFNAFVDAGSPADPALAAVAHQTVNVELNGNDKYENFYGMIYVLANDDAHKSVNELRITTRTAKSSTVHTVSKKRIRMMQTKKFTRMTQLRYLLHLAV